MTGLLYVLENCLHTFALHGFFGFARYICKIVFSNLNVMYMKNGIINATRGKKGRVAKHSC